MTVDGDAHIARYLGALGVIHRMEAALGANSVSMADHFYEDFLWRGNYGSGAKHGISEFRRNWQLPFRAAFTDRDYKTERFMADGDWAACFGHIEATHSGTFKGIPATGQRVTIPYTDSWRVEEGRIADNPVSIDLAYILFQLGRDVFAGEGWETFDRGEKTPPISQNVPEQGPTPWPSRP